MPGPLHDIEKALFTSIAENRISTCIGLIDIIHNNTYKAQDFSLACKNESNGSFLYYALRNGNREVATHLITLQAHDDNVMLGIEDGGNTLIHAAVMGGDAVLLQQLLDAPVFNQPEHQDRTMAYLMKPNHGGQTVLHMVYFSQGHSQEMILERLLEKIFSYLQQHPTVEVRQQYDRFINQKTTFGNTALHLICQNNHYKLAKTLMMYGASFKFVNNKGKTALELAPFKTIDHLLCEFSVLGRDLPSIIPMKNKAGEPIPFETFPRLLTMAEQQQVIALDCTMDGKPLAGMPILANMVTPEKAAQVWKQLIPPVRNKIIKHAEITLFLNPHLNDLKQFLEIVQPKSELNLTHARAFEHYTFKRLMLLAQRNDELTLFNRLQNNVSASLADLQETTCTDTIVSGLRTTDPYALTIVFAMCLLTIFGGAIGMAVRSQNDYWIWKDAQQQDKTTTTGLLSYDPVFWLATCVLLFGMLLVPLVSCRFKLANMLDHIHQPDWEHISIDLRSLTQTDLLSFLPNNNLIQLAPRNDMHARLNAIQAQLNVVSIRKEDLRSIIHNLETELSTLNPPHFQHRAPIEHYIKSILLNDGLHNGLTASLNQLNLNVETFINTPLTTLAIPDNNNVDQIEIVIHPDRDKREEVEEIEEIAQVEATLPTQAEELAPASPHMVHSLFSLSQSSTWRMITSTYFEGTETERQALLENGEQKQTTLYYQ